MGLHDLTAEANKELKVLASQHPRFESFLQDVQKIAENVWHSVRVSGEQAVEEGAEQVVTDAEKDVTEPAQATPAADNPDDAKPAEDPSPVPASE